MCLSQGNMFHLFATAGSQWIWSQILLNVSFPFMRKSTTVACKIKFRFTWRYLLYLRYNIYYIILLFTMQYLHTIQTQPGHNKFKLHWETQ